MRKIIKTVDPEGVENRTAHRLSRRRYHCKVRAGKLELSILHQCALILGWGV